MTKEKRRLQILDAAMEVFIERGYNGTTTVEIAKRANVAEVTLFRYFGSKQEIFLEGIRPVLFNTLEETVQEMDQLSPEEKLTHVLADRIRFVNREHQIVQLILSEKSLFDELKEENFLGKIVEFLKKLIHDIGIKEKNEEGTLRLLMGSILSFLYLPTEDESKIEIYVKKIASMIMDTNSNQSGGVK